MRVTAAGVLGCLLLGAGLAAAGVVKYRFTGVTFPDGTVGTITAGSKIATKSQFTTCDYYADPNDAYLGMYQSPDFATDDPVALEDFCWSHYYERQ